MEWPQCSLRYDMINTYLTTVAEALLSPFSQCDRETCESAELHSQLLGINGVLLSLMLHGTRKYKSHNPHTVHILHFRLLYVLYIYSPHFELHTLDIHVVHILHVISEKRKKHHVKKRKEKRKEEKMKEKSYV